MQGSTFIHEPERSKLGGLAGSLELLDELDVVDMDSLLTLDFETALLDSKLRWTTNEQPAVLDEAAGLVVTRINPEALRHVLAHPELFDAEMHEDLDRLREFVAQRGDDHFYELSTW